MHHAAAHHFQPAGLLAHAAALAGTHHALHVDFGRRLGEGEERRTETHAQRFFEEHPEEFLDGALEVGEADVLVDQQAFDLMEHRRVSDIGVAAIDTAGADDADRRLLRFHGAYLNRRGVGTQQHVRVEIEGVVHRPRRVVARDIERLEVVVVVFDFRPLGHAVADMGEELLDTLKRAGDRVQTTGSLATTRQGHVDTLGGQLLGEQGLLKHGFAGIQGVLHLILGSIDQGASLWALFGRQLAQSLHQGGQFAFLAKVLNPELFQGIDIFTSLHGLKRLRDQCIQIFHLQTPDTK